MNAKPVVLALIAALPLAGCGSTSHETTKPRRATPTAFDASRFVRTVDNPWFPLAPGSVYRYRGVKDGEPSTEVVRVTNRTHAILGVDATAVTDRLYEHGRLAEDTVDWYAQDRDGNVWYLGEATRELDRHGGTASTSGSWQAGVDGARAGIYMPAKPAVGQSFRQEYLKGEAEDHFEVAERDVRVRVPYGSSDHALRTREWTPLEPDVVDAKFYVRGVGTVLERTVKGANERNELVSFKRG
ncbi:MAG TPA: hypothetical protein VJT75_01355 [Thermoleophilaceae bacterium]|nr:hypothetical protein [Thermoleophilaceae bacterium]